LKKNLEKTAPLIYLLLGVIFIITVPILMVFRVGEINQSASETKILIPEIRHSKEAVLILKTATGIELNCFLTQPVFKKQAAGQVFFIPELWIKTAFSGQAFLRQGDRIE